MLLGHGAPKRKIIRRFFPLGWLGFLSGIQFLPQPLDFALKVLDRGFTFLERVNPLFQNPVLLKQRLGVSFLLGRDLLGVRFRAVGRRRSRRRLRGVRAEVPDVARDGNSSRHFPHGGKSYAVRAFPPGNWDRCSGPLDRPSRSQASGFSAFPPPRPLSREPPAAGPTGFLSLWRTRPKSRAG